MVSTPRSHRYPAYILLALLLFVTACQPSGAKVTPVEQPETPVEPSETIVAQSVTPAVAPDYTLPRLSKASYPCERAYTIGTIVEQPLDLERGYVLDQIILTGKEEDIKFIAQEIDAINDTDGPLEPFEPLTAANGDVISVSLYPLLPGQSVWEVMSAANQLALQENRFVFAEPNYLVGLGPGGGSGINGAPAGVAGTPEGYARGEFLSQWALTGASGIHLFDNSLPHRWTPKTLTGANVAVAIFDTTPLEAGMHTISWAVQPFDLCVWQPGLMFGTSGAPSGPVSAGQPISPGEHGLFVTGLAHGVSPAAQYTLVEVLDAEARGDVYTLLRAMRLYARWRGSLDNTVINLSLGLEVDRRPELVDQIAIELLKEILSDQKGPDYLAGQVAQDFPVTSLGVSLAIYQQQGAVIVAAAGNQSRNNPNAPARFPEVIGVAASNASGIDACFTNLGDLAAPGGDAQNRGGCSLDAGTACPANQAGCEYALISLVSQNASASGYAYWQGTSFAAPLVSGLATLLLEAHPSWPAGDVRAAIECGLSPVVAGASPTINRLGLGIIDVEKTVNICP